jgi:DNA-binding transcriptional LysR family regulator
MEPDRKILLEIWRWLPLFRVVAETENITRASQTFSVTPPAVSKALQQIERALGRKLFDRAGRRLTLNPHGHALLSAVREAEKRLADVVSDLGAPEVAGHVRLGTVGQLGRVFLVPATSRLLEQHPRLQISIVHLEPGAALDRLKNATLDVFLGLNVTVGEPLIATRLAELEIGIYAGRSHPLFGREDAGLEEIEQHPFAAQVRPGLMRSVWPASLRRRVTLETDSHAVALEACLSGSHLMAMERVIARPLIEEQRLSEVKIGLLPAARLVLCQHSERKGGSMMSKVARTIAGTVKEIAKEA